MIEIEYPPEQRPDPILPVRIEHLVDEIIIEGKLSAFYNYLDYHFETDTAVMRGRVYLDTANEITLFGPFANARPLVNVEDPALEKAVRGYAERRFSSVKRLEAE
jgi:hypothetical protein